MTPKADKITLTLATVSYLASLYSDEGGSSLFDDSLPEWLVSLLYELFIELKFV